MHICTGPCSKRLVRPPLEQLIVAAPPYRYEAGDAELFDANLNPLGFITQGWRKADATATWTLGQEKRPGTAEPGSINGCSDRNLYTITFE